ncbi:MAG: nuclear transport factor 2 family protein [Thermoanaerobaculia bacterium]
MTEENDVVIAEGAVRSQKKDGVMFHAVFCDVFEMRDGKISKLISYLMPITPDPQS